MLASLTRSSGHLSSTYIRSQIQKIRLNRKDCPRCTEPNVARDCNTGIVRVGQPNQLVSALLHLLSQLYNTCRRFPCTRGSGRENIPGQ